MQNNAICRLVGDEWPCLSCSGLGVCVCVQAPAFGEDDFRVCMASGVIRVGEDVPCPVDLNGRFEEPVTDFLGRWVRALACGSTGVVGEWSCGKIHV
jgi:isoleucyl-tRNA synthetase